ncbi:MAG: DUF916 domain-containing protein [bacterium]
MNNLIGKKKLILTTISLIFLLLPCLILAEGQTAPPAGGFSALPAYPDPADPRTNAWFVYELAPGQDKEDALKILNNSNEYIDLKIYAVDAEATIDGDFILTEEQALKNGIGAWLKLSIDEISIAPQKEALIPFTINIPAETKTGDYLGGLIVEPANQSNDRLAVRIYETVPGQTIKKLAIADFYRQVIKKETKSFFKKIIALDRQLIFVLKLKNEGNVLLEPTARLSVKNIWGAELAELRPNIKTIFPHQTNEYPVAWDADLPFFGRYTAEIAIDYNDDFPALRQKLVFWIIPYQFLGWLVILIVLLIISRLFLLFYRETKKPKIQKEKKPKKKRLKLNKNHCYLLGAAVGIIIIASLVILIKEEKTNKPEPTINNQKINKNDQQRKDDLNKIKETLLKYYQDNSQYPISQKMIALNQNDLLQKALVEKKYLDELPQDPLANQDQNYYYSYQSADGKSFKLTCLLENQTDPAGQPLGSYWLYALTD